MKKTTFLDFLKERDDNELIYVGTKSGAGWIVIETTKTILENMDKIENWLRGNVEHTRNNAQETLNRCPAKIVSLQNQIMEHDGGDKKELARLKSALFDNENKYAAAFHTRKKTTTQLETWKKLEDRKLVDTYKHETEPVGTAVILEGIDNGDLWFKDEKKRNNPITKN